METLSALQEKIEQLIGYSKELKLENDHLKKENKQLAKKLDSLETAMLENKSNVKQLSQEKEKTKGVVDDLIKTIDSLVQTEKQP